MSHQGKLSDSLTHLPEHDTRVTPLPQAAPESTATNALIFAEELALS
jgi:hypothetical protein